MHRTGRLPSKLSIETKLGDDDYAAPSNSGNSESSNSNSASVTSDNAITSNSGTTNKPSGPTVFVQSNSSSTHIILNEPSFLGRMSQSDYDSGRSGSSSASGSGTGSGTANDSDSENYPPLSGVPQERDIHRPSALAPLVRPALLRFHSSPASSTLSPTRHQFRLPNQMPREIKETLNASYREDETGSSINQYTVNEVIGNGSFGSVRLAIDKNTNTRYAIKEYSKQRLKKLNRTELMQLRRKGMRGRPPPRTATPQQPSSSSDSFDPSNPINLIRHEVAIMKKLDHLNIVNLVEVLDDPHGDLLYIILEYCEKGVIMPVNKEEHPSGHYSEEQCRLYFRDMILGVEYLHSQGIIHRDIKADNVLVSEDDVVKIVDFGVSEMFEKGNDVIKKTAGSPAYMAPELIYLNGVGEPSQVNRIIYGRAADIWSMGVLLYYMRFGFLPFQADTVTDLYYEILTTSPRFDDDDECDEFLKDLLLRLLEKDPLQRIKMDQIRDHPWVTCQGQDLLLSTEENTADCITPVTEEDLLSAFELIEGVMDLDQATAKLRKLHGWRGSLNGSISRESSKSPVSMLSEGSDSGTHSMFKLTRALNEILAKDRATGNCPVTYVSRSSGTSPLLDPYNMATSPTKVELTPSSAPFGNRESNDYFNHQQQPIPKIITTTSDSSIPTRKVESDDCQEQAPDTQPDYNNGDPVNTDFLPLTENLVVESSNESTKKENIETTTEQNSAQMQRRPSRSRTRQFLGLEMTSIRSRSLDTDDRL
ncbi:serine/threonine protein kinase TOS3 [Sugiyamaella lignohabitans]|uniref:Serine/threonine protein kinase TOS3 n=1 Tax=Sugiyamaella lignohabitans TaxID=796027 RepID=A0A167FGM1_9ASCO|nr:serine/threonine protein kinase TOS3 [Sugiyamaella lignohabitans]ANB15274.1 serine/threonine protein kinase TOS3 [Sugiyamaella lignohabitans]